MADPDFKLAEFGKQTKVILDCIESATDQKPFNRKAARDAIKAMGDMLGPGEASDSDPALSQQETLKRKQEIATGDRSRASDSRYNTDYSIDAIFGGGKHDNEATSLTHSVDEIFGGSRPVLGEG
jgi:hypothetical protein